MKNLTFAAALLCATAFAPATFAQDSDLSVSTGVDYVTEYVFRGASLGGSSVQPYVEASVGSFTVGGWFSTGIGEDSFGSADELDLYAGYSVPLDGSISLDLGATYYHYPQFGSFLSTSEDEFAGLNAGSYEVSASVGFAEVPLAPSVSAYYDFTFENFTLEASVGHSVPVGEKQSLDFGLTGGLVDGQDGFSYEWATASASLGHSLTDDVSVYVGANYAVNSEDFLGFDLGGLDPNDFGSASDGNSFWVGTGISAGF